MVSFSTHWRSRDRHHLVGIDPSGAKLLDSIDLAGMRVSLVVGPSVERDFFLSGKPSDKSDVMPALGLINLSSMLLAHRAKVVTRDYFLDPSFVAAERAALSDRRRLEARVRGAADPDLDSLVARWADSVLSDAPEVIGLSARTEPDPLTFLLFQRHLARIGRRVPVVVGGCWRAAELPDALLGEFDFLVANEGEVPLLLLCSAIARGWNPWRVPGLCRAERPGEPLRTSECQHHLDVLAPPRLDGIDLSRYSFRLYTGWRGVTIPYQFVVGCPYNCAYCNLANKRRYKLRSIPLVIRDLEQLHAEFGVEQFLFLNSAFNVEPRYAEELLQAMIDTGRAWRWSDCARPKRLDPGLLRRMRQSGCEWLNWGLDTSSERLDALYRRGLARVPFGRLMKAADQAGIRNAVNVIVGMPHETQADVDELLAFLDRHKASIHHVFVYKYHFIPHSDLGVHPERYGLRRDATGTGVDELDGLAWPQRHAQGVAALESVSSVAHSIASMHGTCDW
jgi:radical SAM superfamily enzyme YgiQ (UPF0313 family)